MKRVEQDDQKTCDVCGASIYKEHIDQGIARSMGGKLMCPPCLLDHEKEETALAASGLGDLAPIAFDDGGDDEDQGEMMSSSRIHQSSAATLGVGHGWDDSKYQRPLDTRAISATRCRTFHAKLTVAALEYMNELINNWVDENENITIKFSNSTIGMFEGKQAEPHVVVTLFY